MKAKIRAIPILAALCLLLGAATALLVAYSPRGAAVEADSTVYSITDISVADFAALAITNSKMSFGVLQQGQTLEVVSAVEGNYDMGELRSLVYAACHLTGSRKLTEQASWEEYGYGAPQAEVTVIKTDGTSQQVSILMQNPIDGNYYMYSHSGQAVYLVSQQVAELFLRGESDFFSHTVFPQITVENYTDLGDVSLDFNGKGRNYTLTQSEGSFRLTEPITHRVSAVTALQELVNYVSALYADAYVAQGASLSSYGFDDYTLRIELSFGGQSYSALLLDQGGDVCLMADEATGDVYEVQRANLPMLMRDYQTLLGGKVYQYAAGDVSDVTVSDAGAELFFQLSGEGESLGATVGGKLLDSGAVAQLMAALCAPEIEREAKDITLAEAELALTFTMKNGSKERVEFIPQGGEDYAVSIGGVTNFITTGGSVQKIRSAVEEYKK